MAEYISKDETMDVKTMCDLYINNAGGESPVWTDGHIEELLDYNDNSVTIASGKDVFVDMGNGGTNETNII